MDNDSDLSEEFVPKPRRKRFREDSKPMLEEDEQKQVHFLYVLILKA